MGQPIFTFVLRNKLKSMIMEKRTEQRKHFHHTHIAGFMYAEGCLAFRHLQVGTKLDLVREENNRHDLDAVAVYYRDYKLRFIPMHENEILAQFLDMGHTDLFEVRIARICQDAHPERQVYVNIYIRRYN